MFVVQALFDFSSLALQTPNQNTQSQETPKEQLQVSQHQPYQELLDPGKRKRSQQHDLELKKEGGDKDFKQAIEKDQSQEEQQKQIQYLSFSKGDKILVHQAFDNGWWYGNLIRQPDQLGFFPSNFVKVGAKPPPPKPAQDPEANEKAVYDPAEGGDWVSKQLKQAEETQQKPLTSDYYQGIRGYKYVRINDNNKNILNANYVKFDVNTGLAKVPVKDQAPAAKAVRQMGYYFDYHQWNEERNKNPEAYKNKPDPSKKNKKKKLHLVGMGKDA